MNINVTMASGDTDEWAGAADAIDDRGSLLVLYRIDGHEVSEDMKTIVLSREIPQPDNAGEPVPPMVKSETYQITAQYAPGMWMKVEFE